MSSLNAQANDETLLCSVIIPVYNGAAVIERCLDALAAQTISPRRYEIVVVDDGSRDQTPALVRAWAARRPAVTLRLATQENAGPASARNHGARLAQAPLLLFTDADCIPAPGWIAAFLGAFASADPPSAAMGAYRSAQRTPAARFAQMEFEERYALMAQHASIDFVATYSAAYQGDVFLAAGGFDSAFRTANNEDTELAYRLSAQGKRMVFVPDAIVEHEHDATWRSYWRTKMGRGYWRAVVYQRHPGKAVRDSYTPQMLKLQIPLALLATVGSLAALALRRPRLLALALPFLASTLPMLRFVQQREPGVAFWVPWGAWLRATAFLVGIARAAVAGADLSRNGRTARTAAHSRMQEPNVS